MTLNGHYPYTEKVHSTKYHSLLSLTRRHSLASTDLSIKAWDFDIYSVNRLRRCLPA